MKKVTGLSLKTDSIFKLMIGLLIIVFPELMFSQNASASFADNQPKQTETNIKTFTGKCVVEKVYLNIIVNGITESTFYSVERSIDGTNYETIGMINFIGSPVMIDLLYSYIDETPLKVNSYYRLVTYNNLNDPLYSDAIEVFPSVAAASTNTANPLQTNKN
jgi:hypothetical protein